MPRLEGGSADEGCLDDFFGDEEGLEEESAPGEDRAVERTRGESFKSAKLRKSSTTMQWSLRSIAVAQRGLSGRELTFPMSRGRRAMSTASRIDNRAERSGGEGHRIRGVIL